MNTNCNSCPFANMSEEELADIVIRRLTEQIKQSFKPSSATSNLSIGSIPTTKVQSTRELYFD